MLFGGEGQLSVEEAAKLLVVMNHARLVNMPYRFQNSFCLNLLLITSLSLISLYIAILCAVCVQASILPALYRKSVKVLNCSCCMCETAMGNLQQVYSFVTIAQ